MRIETPRSAEETAEILRAAAAAGSRVRFSGGRTKIEWGQAVPQPDVEISTNGLERIIEHNRDDLTAVVEAGVRLADLQAALAAAGQTFAVDPPGGASEDATVGGVMATGDSGPVRHRYGAPRDLLLGITVVLSDGTVANAGGKVIKNVAGYDLAKLFAGSFGTLGMVARVSLRLHPLPRQARTAIGDTGDVRSLQSAVMALAAAPLEFESVDVRWRDGRGTLLARCGGAAPEARSRQAAVLMAGAGMETSVIEEDGEHWRDQRAAQRALAGTVVRVSGLPSALSRVATGAGRTGASLVGRACLGLSWVTVPPMSVEDTVGAVEDLRWDLSEFPCVVLDAPREVREKVDVWGQVQGAEPALMRRVKAQFDPAGVCNPGVFVGGI